MSEARSEDRSGRQARRWYIRLGGAALRPLTMFQGSSGKASMFRVGYSVFVVQFAQNFPGPGEWTAHSVTAFVALLFALPAESLFGRIPVTETLGAFQAFFSAITAKAVDKARDYYGAYRYQPPAPGEPPPEYGPGPQPPDGAVG